MHTEPIKAPWLKFYGEVPHSLNYPDGSMYDLIGKQVEKYPNYTAFMFMGKRTSYRAMDAAGLPPVFVPTSELVKTVSWHPHSFIGLATL